MYVSQNETDVAVGVSWEPVIQILWLKTLSSATDISPSVREHSKAKIPRRKILKLGSTANHIKCTPSTVCTIIKVYTTVEHHISIWGVAGII